MMRVVSLCSSVGGLDLGFHRAGCRTVALCEVDEWRRAVLAKHWPGVPCHPDLTTLEPADLPAADVLIGGTPCQDLSVAGQRAGLDGERSGLFWHFMRVRNHLGPEWTVWENVAGALSSNDGLDFASVLAAFVGADVLVPGGGWPGAGVVAGPWGGCVFRVLDAQHFGVPQRRRRVFVVGRLGGPCPPEVLLEPASGSGDPQTRRGAGARTAGAPVSGTLDARGKLGGNTADIDRAGAYVANGIAAPLTRGSSGAGVSEPGRRKKDDVNIVSTLQARGTTGGFDVDPAMAAGGHLIAVGDDVRGRAQRAGGADGAGSAERTTDPEAAEGDAGRLDGAAPDSDGVRAPDGLAGRVDVAGVKLSQTKANGHNEFGDVAPTLNQAAGRLAGGIRELTPGEDMGEAMRVFDPAGVAPRVKRQSALVLAEQSSGDRCAYDPQPDGRRYAAAGDGVVANVAEWIARRIIEHGGAA